MTVRQKLFAPEVLIRYPAGTKPEQLRHIYNSSRNGRDGKPMPFAKVVVLLDQVKQDVKDWYKRETGKDFDSYHLGDMLVPVRQKFWTDPRFIEAFTSLGLDLRHIDKAFTPWWNELATTELDHQLTADGAIVTVGRLHSLETQLARSGLELPIRSVSVAGIIETTDGFLAIGLRGGVSFPNTYHVTAGSLGLTPGIQDGTQSIYDFFKQKELLLEFGVPQENISSSRVISRVVNLHPEVCPMYVFLINVGMPFVQLQGLYERNKDEDKGEHTRLVAIPKRDVMAFIEQHYRGVAANKYDRTDSERVLLHHGALALLSYTDYPISELQKLFREGVW